MSVKTIERNEVRETVIYIKVSRGFLRCRYEKESVREFKCTRYISGSNVDGG